MGVTNVAAQVSELATQQWGLLTTAQAETQGITRLQLARLADVGILERIDRGIYGVPAALDAHTPVRAAWISLAPKTLAEERLKNLPQTGVISHSSAASLHQLGDLLDDVPEITTPERKQSRRNLRLHKADLHTQEITLVAGLPTTTVERTIADLLRDGHDPSHIAGIIGESLRRGVASPDSIARAIDPLAKKYLRPDGIALLEHLLDLIGMNPSAIVKDLTTSSLGQGIFAAGQLDAVRSLGEVLTRSILPPGFAKELIDSLGPVLESASQLANSQARETLSSVDFPTLTTAKFISESLDTAAIKGTRTKNTDK